MVKPGLHHHLPPAQLPPVHQRTPRRRVKIISLGNDIFAKPKVAVPVKASTVRRKNSARVNDDAPGSAASTAGRAKVVSKSIADTQKSPQLPAISSSTSPKRTPKAAASSKAKPARVWSFGHRPKQPSPKPKFRISKKRLASDASSDAPAVSDDTLGTTRDARASQPIESSLEPDDDASDDSNDGARAPSSTRVRKSERATPLGRVPMRVHACALRMHAQAISRPQAINLSS